MPLLRVPKEIAENDVDGEDCKDFEVPDWLELALMQESPQQALECGDTAAMQDRGNVADEWTAASRRVFVHRWFR